MKRNYISPHITIVHTSTESPIMSGSKYYPGTGGKDNPGTGCSNKLLFYYFENKEAEDAEKPES